MALTPAKNLTKYGRIARFNDLVDKGIYTPVPKLKESYDARFKLFDNLTLEIKEFVEPVSVNSLDVNNSGFEISTSSVPSHHSCFEELLHSTHDSFIESNPDLIKNGRISSNEEGIIRRDSLSRTRQQLIDYACMHESEWKSFITLTITDSSLTVSDANKKFSYFITNWRKKFPDLKYLGVPEYQKRGAIHYHILTNVPCGSELIPKQDIKKIWSTKYQKYYDLEFYNLKYWDLGFTTAFDFKLTNDSFNAALYVTKYLYKDFDNRFFGHTKLLKSNNLLKPDVFRLKLSSSAYINAMQYLNKKGYCFELSEIPSSNPYAIPCKQATITLCSQEDFNIIQTFLKDDLPF